MCNTRTYNCWRHMRYRTTARLQYLDKGITMCDAWNDFEVFLNDMGECPSPIHSIERINNALGYSPDNCMWATPVRQAYNRFGYKYICKRNNCNSYFLQFQVRPGLRITKSSPDINLLEDFLSDLLYERQMHLALGYFV